MAPRSLKSGVLDFLSHQTVKHGESVEFSWFIFRTIVADGQTDLETLDFRAMASLTRDFSAVEKIHAAQMEVLQRAGAEGGRCTLQTAALVSRSYAPGAKRMFMHRPDELKASDSGWFVGIADDLLDVNDPANLEWRSLYELSIHDNRLTPFWLLPAGFRVTFDGEKATVHHGRERRGWSWLRRLFRRE